MRTLGILLMVTVSWAPSAVAEACTPGLGHEQQQIEYYKAATSVYVAVAEDFKPEDPRYPSDNFAVRLRPIEWVWGEPLPREPVNLEFTAGACVDWFLWDDDDSESLDGKRYFVFVAPQSEEEAEFLPAHSRLHVLPAGDGSASDGLILLGRLQATGGAPPRPEEPPLPEGSPSEEPAFWTRSYLWPWAVGGAATLFIFGLILGRAIRPRDKRRKNP